MEQKQLYENHYKDCAVSSHYKDCAVSSHI